MLSSGGSISVKYCAKSKIITYVFEKFNKQNMLCTLSKIQNIYICIFDIKNCSKSIQLPAKLLSSRNSISKEYWAHFPKSKIITYVSLIYNYKHVPIMVNCQQHFCLQEVLCEQTSYIYIYCYVSLTLIMKCLHNHESYTTI